MSDKAEWAYRTISEVSEELDVPPHVLRFWETKFTQLKPMKRSGSRRYYKASDIDLLIRIRDLLYRDGFTIKGAQKALKEKKTDAVAEAPDTTTPIKGAPQSPSTTPAAHMPPSELTKALEALTRLDARLDALLAGK